MRTTLLLLAAMASASASAADWLRLSETDYGTFYLDRQTIRSIDNNVRRAWVLVSRDKPSKSGYLSEKVLEEYDCKEGRRRALQGTGYKGKMGAGDTTHIFEFPSEWSYIPPDTVGATFMNAICSSR